ncbi:hypothetical protein FHY09_000149 [Xanthomonas sp. 60]
MQSGREPNKAYNRDVLRSAGRDATLRAALPSFPDSAPCRPAGAFVFQLQEVTHV